MTAWRLESWDQGRVTVVDEACELLKSNGLETFDAIMQYGGGDVAKQLLKERTTTRLKLQASSEEPQTLFLKRHSPPPFKEYIKPWLRLTKPILGARNEWLAILKFHEVGLDTMRPIAWGQQGGYSFLLTRGIDDCQSLAEFVDGTYSQMDAAAQAQERRRYVRLVGRLARKMHEAGLHHQDFYLYHLLVPLDQPSDQVYIIDLGRARQVAGLKRGSRWVVKDLGQLMFAASIASRSDRLRFLQEYLGRRVEPSDYHWLKRIERKAAGILRHSTKNSL